MPRPRSAPGRLPGVLSARSASTAVLTDSNLATFAIGGLAFRFAISDDRPYQRATATFKKEQLDVAADVGDQSLVGWWKRGQLSFHKGAGINFLEILDGQGVANRYQSGTAVTVSTPGAVTLSSAWTAGTPAVPAAADVFASGAHAVFLTEAGEIHSTNGSGAYVQLDGSTITAAAGDPAGNIYVATDTFHIERATNAFGSKTYIYLHDKTISFMWYAKGRLFFVDSAGGLYQLAPNPTSPPVTIVSGDRICTFVEPAGGNWFLTDSPSSVYIGHSSGTIYSVDVDTSDGSVPVLSAPIEACRVPTGETLVAIGYYLGSMVIQTDVGVRIAAVSRATVYNPGLILGPRFLTLSVGSWKRRRVVGIDNKVLVSYTGGLASIDLAQAVEGANLTYAWTYERAEVNTRTVGLWGTNPVLAQNAGWIGRTLTDKVPSGTLTTAQHRFGTLENKQFVSVQVMASGSGSITISKVNAAGGVTSIYTMNLTTETTVDLTLSDTRPSISMGLQFTLTRSSTDHTQGPTLLGYQLRALPAPERQRLIRLPLMLLDVERAGAGMATGAPGSAYTRLAELEDMESSGGTFIFQDFRTGESGLCFIESIEHNGRTPPGAHDNGFGGFLFLTIRKL